MSFQKGVAQRVHIVCYDGERPENPINPSVTVAKDTGTFTAATNAPTVVTPGVVVITLTAAEMNADVIAVKVSSTNLEDQISVFYTEDAYTAARAGNLDATISSRSTFDPTTTTVKAVDHTGTPFAAEADIRDSIIDADLSDYEETAATGTTLGEFVAAARAGIIGRMKIVGTTITFYQTNGITPIFTATLNDDSIPTERGKPTAP